MDPATNNSSEDLLKKIEKLDNELGLYKTIVENLPISVFAKNVNNDYRYLIWNRELEKVFGTPASKILGINDYELFDNKEEAAYFRNYDESVMSGREIVDIPQENLTTSEGQKIVHTRKIPIYDSNNQPSILLGCLEDITDNIKTQQALIESEANLREINQMKDKFFSIVAHDLKSPFNTILGVASLLSKNLTDFDQQKLQTCIHILHESAQSTYNLLENLLLWGKSQSGSLAIRWQNINLYTVCTEVSEINQPIASTKKITIQNKINPNLNVKADDNMLQTIVRNLISNAIKYSFQEGKISLTANETPQYVEVCIADEGVGMEPAQVNRIWSLTDKEILPGTAHEKGTGLGLVLCKDFVEKHGGTIRVESAPCQGTKIFFTLNHIN